MNQIAAFTGATVILPTLVGCGSKIDTQVAASSNNMQSGLFVPSTRPQAWNAITYNRQRGLAGAVPDAFKPSLTAVDNAKNFIGKHIAYVAPVPKAMIPAGSIALMIGDHFKGYDQHGATAAHWYDWVKISKEGSNSEVTSNFASWPAGGTYMVLGAGTIEGNAGLDTIYIATLPAGVSLGDTIRVTAHCNLHGEFVDFITL